MDIHIQSYKTDTYKKSVINMGTKFNFRFSPCIIIVNHLGTSSSQPARPYTHTTGSKIMLPNTDQAHDKISVNH